MKEKIKELEGLVEIFQDTPAKFFGTRLFKQTAINKVNYLIGVLNKLDQEEISRVKTAYTEKELSLFDKFSDKEISEITGRTIGAIAFKRWELSNKSKQ